MIYITGDCHGDWTRFGVLHFPQQKDMTKDDYVIVLGDFGIWNNTKQENYWLDWLSQKNFTILFIDGNHENFDRLNNFKEIDYKNGKAHKIRHNIFHLERGYVFEICGNKFYVFGGAQSHDIDDGILYPSHYDSKEDFVKEYKKWVKQNKIFRVDGISWWKEEMPTTKEVLRGFKSLSTVANKVDYVLTHCCPQHIAKQICGHFKEDSLTRHFDEIDNEIIYKKWYFGHYHIDTEIDCSHRGVYTDMIKVI